MNSTRFTFRRNLIALVVSLAAASAAQADVITINGTDITLMSGTGNLTVFDSTTGGSSVTRNQNNSPGSLGQFDPSLGVLTDATGTLTIVAATLTRAGSPGSAGFSYQWLLGGNSMSRSTSTTGSSLSLTTPSFGSLSVISSAANLNNFVGLGNIGQNVTNTQLSANRTGTTLSGTSAGVNPNPVLATESIAYTYLTHSNASFTSSSDTNSRTIDLGQLASGVSANQGFSIFNLGGLGLTGFNASFLSGNDVFNVTGDGGYNTHFAGLSPGVSTTYSGTYRLTFTDDVTGLTQYASQSVRTNSIDLTMTASVVAVPEPAEWTMLIAGLLVVGFIARRRRELRFE